MSKNENLQHVADENVDYKEVAEAARQEARDADQRSFDSFERSDTDGALSQWASSMSANESYLAAEIAENGGMWEFPALFTLEGELVPAKRFYNDYDNPVWGILETESPESRYVAYVNESTAQNEVTFTKNMAKKGYYVGTVLAPAYATLAGSGKGLGSLHTVHAVVRRSGPLFDANAIIVDNGLKDSAK